MPARFNILPGETHGRLIFVAETAPRGVVRRGIFRCQCGTEREFSITWVVAGRTISCGCLRKERAAVAHTKHGEASTPSPEYRSWRSMRARCLDESHIAYPRYGGRGIGICERWDSYPAFLADMGRKPTPAHTIERIDGNLGYEPGNCRWATRKEQALNTVRNRRLTVGGVRRTLSQWSEATGISLDTIIRRLDAGWAITTAVSAPPHSGNRMARYG